MNKRIQKLKAAGVIDGADYVKRIMPSLGIEILSDPGLEGTYNTGLNAMLTKSGSPTVSQSSDVHGGSKSQSFTATLQNDRLSYNLSSPTAGVWYRASAWIKLTAIGGGTASFRFRSLAGLLLDYVTPIVGDGYQFYCGCMRAITSDNLYLYPAYDPGASNFGSLVADDLSIKPIILSSCMKGFKTTSISDVVLRQKLKVVKGNPIGLCANIDSKTDPQNFVLAYVEGTIAYLVKCVAGIYTQLLTISCAWDDGDELKLIKSGTAYSIYKNGTKLGTNQAITDAGIISNCLHAQFSTYEGNLFTSPFRCAESKTITVIGDSISADYYNQWDEIVNNTYRGGNNYTYVRAVGGYNIASNMATLVTAAQNDDCDIIIIELGTNDNDAGDMAALRATLEGNIDTLKTHHPSAVIYYMNVLPRYDGATKTNIRNMIITACANKGVTCWDTYTDPWVLEADMTGDKIHPASGGHVKIATQVLARI